MIVLILDAQSVQNPHNHGGRGRGDISRARFAANVARAYRAPIKRSGFQGFSAAGSRAHRPRWRSGIPGYRRLTMTTTDAGILAESDEHSLAISPGAGVQYPAMPL